MSIRPARSHSLRPPADQQLSSRHPWEDYRKFTWILSRAVVRLDESHGIDLLRWMFGDIKSVYAQVHKVSDLEIS